MKGITDLAKANRKPRAILNDWILLNSLLDSHDHVNPMGNRTQHESDIEGGDVKESGTASWIAACQRVKGLW